MRSCISDPPKCGRRSHFSFQCAKIHSNLLFWRLYIPHTCRNLCKCAKLGTKLLLCCVGTYFTHVQTCDYVRVQSATQWTASVHTFHMSKPVKTFVFQVLAMDCLGSIYLTHVQTHDNVRVQSATQWTATDCLGAYFTHVQTCDNVRVQSATQWIAWVHTFHMSKPVITFVLQVLHTGLLGHILHTCPNL